MKILQRIRTEFWHILPLFLFFLVCFTIINWVETYLFEQIGIRPFRFVEIVVAAGLIAKIVIVADHLRIIHLFKHHPLVYEIVWKTFVYWSLLFLIRLIIRLVPFFFHDGEGLLIDYHNFLKTVNWRLFISIQVYYLMLLFIFLTFQGLTDRIGRKEMKQLFFGRSSP